VGAEMRGKGTLGNIVHKKFPAKVTEQRGGGPPWVALLSEKGNVSVTDGKGQEEWKLTQKILGLTEEDQGT